MPENNAKIREDVLQVLLPEVVFDGWSWQGVKQAAVKAGYKPRSAHTAFPRGLKDVLDYFAQWVDEQTLARLERYDIEEMRIRDRIKTAIMTRFEVLAPYKEAERLALAYWAVPPRQIQASRIVWRSADYIWDWAGDTAKDYNRYTKRGLLSGVMGSSMLVWINDDSPDMVITEAFVDRRIENVMQLGRLIGKVKSGKIKRAL